MSRQRKGNQRPARKPGGLWIGGVIILGAVALLSLRLGRRGAEPTAKGLAELPPVIRSNDASVFAAYGKSPSCKSCHEEEFHRWETSHHALAERMVNQSLEAAAFEPARKIRHGSQGSEAKLQSEKAQIITTG